MCPGRIAQDWINLAATILDSEMDDVTKLKTVSTAVQIVAWNEGPTQVHLIHYKDGCTKETVREKVEEYFSKQGLHRILIAYSERDSRKFTFKYANPFGVSTIAIPWHLDSKKWIQSAPPSRHFQANTDQDEMLRGIEFRPPKEADPKEVQAARLNQQAVQELDEMFMGGGQRCPKIQAPCPLSLSCVES